MIGLLSGSLLLVLAGGDTLGSARFEPRHELSLPAGIDGAVDVRWDSDDRLIVAAARIGVARVPYRDGKLGEPEVLIREGSPPGIVIADRLATSQQFLAIAAPLSEMLWRSRDPSGPTGRFGTWWSERRTGLSFIEDIDLAGRELAVLGIMRAERGMSPDGAIAWAARLDDASSELAPFAFSLAGKGARPFDACAGFRIGHLRYAADGRLLVLPGAEPGLMLYSPEKRLLRSWDTALLGIDIRCDFGDEDLLRFSAEEEARYVYRQRHTYADELLATPSGPLVFVKQGKRTDSAWKAFLLAEDGSVREIVFPIRSPNPHARLRADLRGDRLIVVLSDTQPGRKPRGGRLIELAFGAPVQTKLPVPPASR